MELLTFCHGIAFLGGKMIINYFSENLIGLIVTKNLIGNIFFSIKIYLQAKKHTILCSNLHIIAYFFSFGYNFLS